MKNVLVKWGLAFIWLALGKLGQDLMRWMGEADKLGLSGREAYDYVWRKARAGYHDIGDWLLNLLIEVVLGKKLAQAGEPKKKLKWPRKLSF